MRKRSEKTDIPILSPDNFDLFEAALDAQLIFDFDLVMHAQNARHARAAGVGPDRVIGQFMFDVFPKNPKAGGPDTEEVIRSSIAEVKRTGASHSIPVQRHDLPGETGQFLSHYWSITHAPLRRGDDIVAILQISRDITGEVEGSIRRAAERRAASAGTGLSFFEFVPATDRFDRSDDVDRMFGFESGEAGSVAAPFFERVHPDDLPHVFEEVERVSAAPDGEPAEFDYRVIIPGREDMNHVRARAEMVTNAKDGTRRMVGIFIDRTADVLRETQLQNAVEGRDAMLAEMNHRIKNSLALAVSVLRLQEREQGDDPMIALEKARARINAIAAVHGRLYQDGSIEVVDVDRFLDELMDDQVDALGLNERDLELTIECAPLRLSVERSIPLGMIFGEFVTNAFKYGLPDGAPGSLSVAFACDGNEAILTVVNSGSTDSGSSKPGASSSGTGRRLLDAFATQLQGWVESDLSDDGQYTARVRFPIEI